MMYPILSHRTYTAISLVRHNGQALQGILADRHNEMKRPEPSVKRQVCRRICDRHVTFLTGAHVKPNMLATELTIQTIDVC
jgi:hypothetical protein